MGDNEPVRVDVRIVAATHRSLAKLAAEGTFRADLYYRLAVFLIQTPDLQSYIEDLPLLVQHFLAVMAAVSPAKTITAAAMGSWGYMTGQAMCASLSMFSSAHGFWRRADMRSGRTTSSLGNRQEISAYFLIRKGERWSVFCKKEQRNHVSAWNIGRMHEKVNACRFQLQ